MKKILLVSPPNMGKIVAVNFPINFLSLGSVLLEHGFAVNILNGTLKNEAEFFQSLVREIDQAEPLFIGISAMTAQLPMAVKTAQIIRNKFPEVPLVWGGVHATLFPEETVEDQLVDVAVVGEADETILEIADLFSGKRNSFDSVKGIAYKNSYGEVKFTGSRTPPDLNSLPFPRYDELLDVEDYINRPWVLPGEPDQEGIIRMMDVHTGMGCPHRCAFCINTVVYRSGKYYVHSGYRGKSAERILDEIQILIDKYNVEYINFIDENFFVSKKRLFDFLDGIKERKLKFYWYASVRADYFRESYINEAVVRRMKDAGCFMLATGAESGSQKMLDFLKKDYTIDQVFRVAEILNKHEIYAQFSFMVGLPRETAEDMFATIELIQRLRKIGSYTLIQNPALYRPLPGGSLYEEALILGFKGPRGINEWAANDMDLEGGIKDRYMPWLVRDRKARLVMRYSREVVLGGSRASFGWWWKIRRKKWVLVGLDLVISIMSGVFCLRRKLDYWRMPIEWFIFDRIKGLKKVLR